MARKATIPPTKEQVVEWVRYMGDNYEELVEFYKEKSRFPTNEKFYISPDEGKEIYWKEHGFIRKGDFVVFGMSCKDTSWDGFTIISWKVFPRLVREEIPVYFDEYNKWLEEQKQTEQKSNQTEVKYE